MSFENPASILYNDSGYSLAVSSSQQLSYYSPGLVLAGSGSDGVARFFKVTDDGKLYITGSIASEAVLSGAVAQGTAGTQNQAWYMKITDGTQVLGTGSSAPIWISGTVKLESSSGPSTKVSFNQNLNSTVTLVSSSITSVTLLNSNSNREGAIIYYPGDKNVYVKLGVSASDTSFTVKLSSYGYYEVPFAYAGEISAVWDAIGGSRPYVMVTEITP